MNRTDMEIKILGLEVLNENLGPVDAERFVALIQKEKFDYTKWRQHLFDGLSGEELSRKAMEYQEELKTKKL